MGGMNLLGLRSLISILGSMSSLGIFISPMARYVNLCVANTNTGVETPTLILATILNCLFWMLYELPNTWVHLIVNVIGLILELGYLSIFLRLSTWSHRKLLLLFFASELILYFAILFTVLEGQIAKERRLIVVGVFVVICNIFMYVTPLYNIKEAIMVKSFNVWNAMCCLINGIYWVLYALIDPIDFYVLVGNSVGVLSAALQLFVFFYWKTMDVSGQRQTSRPLAAGQ